MAGPFLSDGLARIKREWMPNDGTLTLGICSRNVGNDAGLLGPDVQLVQLAMLDGAVDFGIAGRGGPRRADSNVTTCFYSCFIQALRSTESAWAGRHVPETHAGRRRNA